MDCTTEARASVTVEVVDASGAPVTDAQVQYAVDGGESKDCEKPFEDGNTYSCAYETEGKFEITATRNGMTASASATVTGDECHVIGQKVKITLSS